MSNDGLSGLENERVNADLQLKVVGGTPRYEFRANGSIEYVPVRRDLDGASQLIGYLWFSDREAAAGYVANQAFSPVSDNLGIVWIEHLSRAKGQGLSPSLAVESFGSLPPGPGGQVILSERATASTLRDLRGSAGFAV